MTDIVRASVKLQVRSTVHTGKLAGWKLANLSFQLIHATKGREFGRDWYQACVYRGGGGWVVGRGDGSPVTPRWGVPSSHRKWTG